MASPSSRRFWPATEGYTTIELMAGLVILAVLVGALTGVWQAVSRETSLTASQAAADARAQGALDAIGSDVRASTCVAGPEAGGSTLTSCPGTRAPSADPNAVETIDLYVGRTPTYTVTVYFLDPLTGSPQRSLPTKSCTSVDGAAYVPLRIVITGPSGVIYTDSRLGWSPPPPVQSLPLSVGTGGSQPAGVLSADLLGVEGGCSSSATAAIQATFYPQAAGQ